MKDSSKLRFYAPRFAFIGVSFLLGAFTTYTVPHWNTTAQLLVILAMVLAFIGLMVYDFLRDYRENSKRLAMTNKLLEVQNQPLRCKTCGRAAHPGRCPSYALAE